jgi:hypothetical protein
VFDAGTEDEALYTTQSGGAGAFVAFADQAAATALAGAVESSALGGSATVTAVPPLALLMLAQEARYTLEVVPCGLAFDAPELPPRSDLSKAQRRAGQAVRSVLTGLAKPPQAASAMASALRGVPRVRLERLLDGPPSSEDGKTEV